MALVRSLCIDWKRNKSLSYEKRIVAVHKAVVVGNGSFSRFLVNNCFIQSFLGCNVGTVYCRCRKIGCGQHFVFVVYDMVF